MRFEIESPKPVPPAPFLVIELCAKFSNMLSNSSLLEYLMRNAGRVVSKTMIMEHVWDYNFSPQTNVVEARVCYLRDKIDKHFDIKLIHTVRGVGYVLRETS